MSDLALRQMIVRESLSWLATPFHHQARLKGVGVDCAQFLIGVYTACALISPPDIGYYSPDWFMHEDRERFAEWLARFCRPIKVPQIGDIVTFRYGRAVSHAGIVLAWGDDGRVIHSYRGAGVIEEECAPHTPLFARYVSAWGYPCPA